MRGDRRFNNRHFDEIESNAPSTERSLFVMAINESDGKSERCSVSYNASAKDAALWKLCCTLNPTELQLLNQHDVTHSERPFLFLLAVRVHACVSSHFSKFRSIAPFFWVCSCICSILCVHVCMHCCALLCLAWLGFIWLGSTWFGFVLTKFSVRQMDGPKCTSNWIAPIIQNGVTAHGAFLCVPSLTSFKNVRRFACYSSLCSFHNFRMPFPWIYHIGIRCNDE